MLVLGDGQCPSKHDSCSAGLNAAAHSARVAALPVPHTQSKVRVRMPLLQVVEQPDHRLARYLHCSRVGAGDIGDRVGAGHKPRDGAFEGIPVWHGGTAKENWSKRSKHGGTQDETAGHGVVVLMQPVHAGMAASFEVVTGTPTLLPNCERE